MTPQLPHARNATYHFLSGNSLLARLFLLVADPGVAAIGWLADCGVREGVTSVDPTRALRDGG